MMSQATAEDAERAREEAQQAAQREAESQATARQAVEEAEQAKALAASSATAAQLARREADLAVEQANTLRRQLENLQLRQTESGVVVTLGDVLFESGQTELREEAMASLVEVVDLLQSEPEKLIRIEGHTDSTGESTTNLKISQARAEAVQNALRITSYNVCYTKLLRLLWTTADGSASGRSGTNRIRLRTISGFLSPSFGLRRLR